MLSFTAEQPMRLRDDPPAITQPPRPQKKRKTPPSAIDPHIQQQHIQGLPPPHALMHPLSAPLPPGYPYPPSDYSPGGIPGVLQQPHQGQLADQSQGSSRTLSNSKRAEQNRKAQRAFRERRDQHVKALESRSDLLDAALQNADEANRRWEECRALVDQLRVENAALRAAVAHAHLLPPNPPSSSTPTEQDDHRPAESAPDPSTDAAKK